MAIPEEASTIDCARSRAQRRLQGTIRRDYLRGEID
jgi:hypothetical protein